MSKPCVTKYGMLSMQVCIPTSWTDAEVEAFANTENPAGTTAGWSIRKRGDKLLAGDDERVVCSADAGMVHVVLDC